MLQTIMASVTELLARSTASKSKLLKVYFCKQWNAQTQGWGNKKRKYKCPCVSDLDTLMLKSPFASSVPNYIKDK